MAQMIFSNIWPGPCGPQFIVAYRCFLDSKEKEQGSDCVESFQSMQACFHEHEEHYKEFLTDGKEEEEAVVSKTEEELEYERKNLLWHQYNFAK